MQRVHHILSSLRAWDEQLPASLKRWSHGSPRNVLSLHLHFNHCVILTTRPILLHVFKKRLNLGNSSTQTEAIVFSPTIMALAQSCVQAACTSNSILSTLFVEGTLAMFGYFDAQYLFTSTMILIMSAVMEPDSSMSDAIQTAFNLLRSMSETGNVSASDNYQRLMRVHNAIKNMREGTNSRQNETPLGADSAVAQEAPVENSVQNLNGSKTNWSERIIIGRPEMTTDLQMNGTNRPNALQTPFMQHFLDDLASNWLNPEITRDQSVLGLVDEMGSDFATDFP